MFCFLQVLDRAQHSWTNKVLSSVQELQSQAQALVEGQLAEARVLLKFGEQDSNANWQKVMDKISTLKCESEDIKARLEAEVCSY